MRSRWAWAIGVVLTLAAVACDGGTVPPRTEVVTAPPAAEPRMDSLGVTCDGRTAEVDAARVQASVDGVHLAVVNPSDAWIHIEWSEGGTTLPLGSADAVLPLPPGRATVRCDVASSGYDPTGRPGASFRVEPSDGWIEPMPTCGGDGMSVTFHDPAAGATGVPDPAATMARHGPDGAEVIPVGYRTDGSLEFGMLVDGVMIEVNRYFADGAGGWLISQRIECSPT